MTVKSSASHHDDAAETGINTTANEKVNPPPQSKKEKDVPESGLKVLFLSSDTGGGHRASAESLGRQFELLYPGSQYVLMDVVSNHAPFTSNLESRYKHLSANPSQWKTVYHISNTRAVEFMFDIQNAIFCEKECRKSIQEYNPHVVVSVHPMMTNLPTASCAKLSAERNRHLPVFTVVTDLGSAHCLWFCNGVDKLFIASDAIRTLAMERGKVPPEKIVQIGLPIRHDFSIQANLLGDRHSQEGKSYQQSIRQQLPEFDEKNQHKKTVLVMGGGEGVGSLSSIVNALYIEFITQNISANILVVCGRNETLRQDLNTRNWENVFTNYHYTKETISQSLSEFSFSYCGSNNDNSTSTSNNDDITTQPSSLGYYLTGNSTSSSNGCIEGGVAHHIRKILSTSSMSKANAITAIEPITTNDDKASSQQDTTTLNKNDDEMTDSIEAQTTNSTTTNTTDNPSSTNGIQVNVSVESSSAEKDEAKDFAQVSVTGLGFVNNMAEYMVASDVLVTKAGPGTIAEAASLSLPVVLTSFLPGQEEGNVDFVQNGNFGVYQEDPPTIATTVATWLQDESTLVTLSQHAKKMGAPNAARDIVSHIGDLAMKWKNINQAKDRIEQEEAALLGVGTTSGVFQTVNYTSGNTILPNHENKDETATSTTS